ncbi:MAG: hypothetical protein ABI175_24885 [Polyangiales bacterium]
MRTLPAGSASGDAAAVDIRTGSRPKLEAATESAPPPEGGARSEAAQRLRSLPPFDPTVARPSRKPLPRTLHPTPKPILASDCLRDDAAPIEPNDRATQLWAGSLGAAMTVGAVAMFARAGGDGAAMRSVVVAGVTGALVTVLALVLRRYALRGALVLAAVVGGAAALLLFQPDAMLLAARWLAPAPLAAALFLRVSYRSDRTVLALLGVSIALFLAAACFVGGQLVFASGSALVSRLVAGAMVIVAGLSLLGFMGEETTAGCTAWGTLAVVLGAASLIVDAFVRATAPDWLTRSTAAVAVPIAAIGIFQIVATMVGPRLRVKTSSRTSLPAPPPEEPEQDESMLSSDD